MASNQVQSYRVCANRSVSRIVLVPRLYKSRFKRARRTQGFKIVVAQPASNVGTGHERPLVEQRLQQCILKLSDSASDSGLRQPLSTTLLQLAYQVLQRSDVVGSTRHHQLCQARLANAQGRTVPADKLGQSLKADGVLDSHTVLLRKNREDARHRHLVSWC